MNIGIDGNYFRPFNPNEAAIALHVEGVNFNASQNFMRITLTALTVILGVFCYAALTPLAPLSIKVVLWLITGAAMANCAHTIWIAGRASGAKDSLEKTMEVFNVQLPKPAYWLPNMFPAV